MVGQGHEGCSVEGVLSVRSTLALAGFLGATLLSVLGGCTEEADRPDLVTTERDSSGVTIVEHVGIAGVASGWRVRSRPVFRTGWHDDEPTFEFVMHGGIEKDGRILVSDANAPKVYVMDSRGQVVKEIGRGGDGPGEFAVTVDAALAGPGDTIIAQDSYGLAIFDSGGVVADRRSANAWRAGRVGLRLETRLADGSILMVPNSWSPTYGESMWIQAPVGSLALDDLSLDTLFEMDFVKQHPRGHEESVPHGGMAAGRARWIATGRSDLAEIRRYDTGGSLERVVRWDAAAAEVTDEDFERLAEAMRGWSSPELDSERVERMIRDRRESWEGPRPAFVHMRIDESGNVWVFDWTPGTADHERGWIVGSDGAWLGAFDMPRPGRVLDVTDTHLLVLERDEYDVQAIALYEIVKPRG